MLIKLIGRSVFRPATNKLLIGLGLGSTTVLAFFFRSRGHTNTIKMYNYGTKISRIQDIHRISPGYW